jgi:UDP-glucuronate 4-epimerase
MASYIVTGCAGFIGSHLVDSLLERGDTVHGIDSFTDYYPRQLKEENLEQARSHERFSLLEADLAESELGGLVGGSDGVFHLAAQPGVRGSWGDSFSFYVRDNVLATQRVFEAALTAGTRVVFASSSSVYGNAENYPTREDAQPSPISPYGVTKLACEHLADAYRKQGLQVTSLRYFTVYGPRQRPDMGFSRIIGALLSEATFRIFGTGTQSRDATYVADAVAATIAAMDAEPTGAVYNVGGGSEASLLDVIATLESLAGERLRVDHEAAAAGDVSRTAADTTRARLELEWQPRVALAQGLAAQLSWAKSRIGMEAKVTGSGPPA